MSSSAIASIHGCTFGSIIDNMLIAIRSYVLSVILVVTRVLTEQCLVK